MLIVYLLLLSSLKRRSSFSPLCHVWFQVSCTKQVTHNLPPVYMHANGSSSPTQCKSHSGSPTLAASALAAVYDGQDDRLALAAVALQAEEPDRGVGVQAVAAALAHRLQVGLLFDGRRRSEVKGVHSEPTGVYGTIQLHQTLVNLSARNILQADNKSAEAQ